MRDDGERGVGVGSWVVVGIRSRWVDIKVMDAFLLKTREYRVHTAHDGLVECNCVVRYGIELGLEA